MTITTTLVTVLFLAGFVQWATERFIGRWLKGEWMILLSGALGVGLCVLLKLDALALMGVEGLDYPALAGYVITGIIVGSGSNAVHRFLKPLTNKS